MDEERKCPEGFLQMQENEIKHKIITNTCMVLMCVHE